MLNRKGKILLQLVCLSQKAVQYGMYFVSKFNALKFNGKDIDYRECNGFKVSILVH